MVCTEEEFPLCVFLDTQVYRSTNFDWSAHTFASLRKRVDKGSIELVTTDIVKQEIHKGIRKLVNEFVQSIRTGVRRAGVVRSIDDARVHALEGLAANPPSTNEVCDQADRFLSDLQTVTLSPPATALEDAFDRYFAGAAPFGSKSKKSEFPDAVNAITLDHYANVNDKNVFVVSGDDDWQKTCDGHARFVHFRHLSEVLNRAVRAEWRSTELFPDDELFAAIEARRAELKPMLESALSSECRVNLGDGELDNLSLDDLYMDGFVATDIWDGDNELNIRGDLFHSVYYSASISIWDEEMMNVLEHEATGHASLTAQLELTVPLADPKNIQISGADYREGLELEVPLKY